MKIADILEFIRNSDNRDTLSLIESVISETKKSQFNIGSKVIFGRANGKQHFGTIEKINITKAVVKSDGVKWTVPFNLMQLTQKGFEWLRNNFLYTAHSCAVISNYLHKNFPHNVTVNLVGVGITQKFFVCVGNKGS